MSDTDAHEALEAYLRDLGVRSRLAPAELSDVLDECRDHLLSHVEELVGRGSTASAAVASATREFGASWSVAGALRREFQRRALRRVSRLFLLSGPALGLGWLAVVRVGPPAPWRDEAQPVAVAVFDLGGECTSLAAVMVAALSLMMLALPGRFGGLARLREGWQRWAVRGCAVCVALGSAALAQTIGYFAARAVADVHSLSWPAIGTLSVLTTAVGGLFAAPLRTVLALREPRFARRG